MKICLLKESEPQKERKILPHPEGQLFENHLLLDLTTYHKLNA